MIRLYLIGLFLICSALYNEIRSQSYVADTFFIAPQIGQLKNRNIECIDSRKGDPYELAIFEQKKWMAFPVDQIVKLEKPLAGYFINLEKDSANRYMLDVHRFSVQHNASRKKVSYSIRASIALKKLENSADTLNLGVFYYEKGLSYKMPKDSVIAGYERCFNDFRNSFSGDLQNTLMNYGNDNCSSYNFRKASAAADLNLYTQITAFSGLGFYGVEGEVWFSSPEPYQKFKRTSKIIRYLHYSNRQSVALGRKYQQWNYRVNPQWVFTSKHIFLMGFNRWNDMQEARRTFEEMFLFQLSANQGIYFNGLDKKGLIAGIGVSEALSYIVYNKPIFDVAISLSLGYKF